MAAAVLAYMAVAADDQPLCLQQHLGQLLTSWLQPAPYLQRASMHSLLTAAEQAASLVNIACSLVAVRLLHACIVVAFGGIP